MKEFKQKPLKGLDDLGDKKFTLNNLQRIDNGKNSRDSGQLKSVCSIGGKNAVNLMNKKNIENGHFRKLGDAKIGVPRSEETKKKVKEGTSHSWRAILQYTKDGDFLREWKNFTEIEETLSLELNRKINKQPIWGACKKQGQSYGFLWRYKDEMK
jgi:ketol-acid reductoisomerase